METALRSELRFTRADYDALPEDLRVELIDGQLLKMPSPTLRHQKIARRIFQALVEAVGWDRVFFCPVDVPIDNWNVFVPDVVVTVAVPPDADKVILRPLCLFEVLSPSTAGRDRLVKAKRYFKVGAKEVWLLDQDQGTAELRTPRGARLYKDTLRSRAIRGLEIPLAPIFRRE